MRTFISALIVLFFSMDAFSQALPATQLYMFNIGIQSDNNYVFSEPRFLSGFNLNGYNNQPNFFSNDELYLTVQMANDTSQTDIYALNVSKNTITQITATSESEYSPKKMLANFDLAAKGPTEYFSCVRVESDAYNTMRVWQFPIDRSTSGEPAYLNIENTGYHEWIDDSYAALFIVGEPHKLIIANKFNQSKTHVTSNIGRCMQKLSNGNLAFVHKYSKNSWLIKEFNPKTNQSKLITATLPGSEDFVILPDGTYLMGKGSKLYKFNRKKDAEWKEIGDFDYYGIENISRMAISNDGKLAMVTHR